MKIIINYAGDIINQVPSTSYQVPPMYVLSAYLLTFSVLSLLSIYVTFAYHKQQKLYNQTKAQNETEA